MKASTCVRGVSDTKQVEAISPADESGYYASLIA
jgi:hypothetical protein